MMKKILAATLLLLIIYSCTDHKKENPSTAIGAGSAFIRATLDGDFTSAETLLVKDTENLQLFDVYKIRYERLDAATKKSYKDANYNINKFQEVNDSVKLINYSNDYLKKPMDIKVIKENGEWKIDFKYTLAGNAN
ncbi:MAG: hypothetical protein ABIN36_02070 [Ferruginibacter sp.]